MPTEDFNPFTYIEMLPMINIMLRSSIIKYIDDNDITYRKYAKTVGIPWYVAFAIGKGIVNITDIEFRTVIKLLDFHDYNIQIQMTDKSTERVVI